MSREVATRMRYGKAGGLAAVVLYVVVMAIGQEPPSAGAPPQTAEIHGTVRDADSGAPLQGVTVSLDQVQSSFLGGSFIPGGGLSNEGVATTDAHGRYALRNVQPGARKLTAKNPKGISNQRIRSLNLYAGQILERVDFRMRNPGVIAGRVRGEQGQPIASAVVYLVTREYYLGKLHLYIRAQTVTDENGEYVMENVRTGRPWMLMASHRFGILPAISNAPADPARRRPGFTRTYYPDSLTPEGASVVRLSSGQRAEGIDITVRRTPAFCIEGRFVPPVETGAVRFVLWLPEPTFGMTDREGSIGFGPSGTSEPDGKFRICDLAPGDYQLGMMGTQSIDDSRRYYSVTSFRIGDRDVKNAEIIANAPIALPVETSWAGDVPPDTPPVLLGILLLPIYRTWISQEGKMATPRLPGQAELTPAFPDAFRVLARAQDHTLPVYVRDIRYGDESILGRPLLLGSKAGGSRLHVTFGRDPASAAIRVVDPKGHPAADAYVHLLPADARDEAEMAARMQTVQSDQSGYASFDQKLPPGAYYAVATQEDIFHTPEEIHKLWLARSQASKLNAPPNGSMEATITLLAER